MPLVHATVAEACGAVPRSLRQGVAGTLLAARLRSEPLAKPRVEASTPPPTLLEPLSDGPLLAAETAEGLETSALAAVHSALCREAWLQCKRELDAVLSALGM